MTDLKLSLREVISAKKAELAEKSAELDRAWAELAELERLAASLNLVDSEAASIPRPPTSSLPLLDHLTTRPVTREGSETFSWATDTFGMLAGSYRTHPGSPFHK